MNEDEKHQICVELDRLLCDPKFERSPTLAKLLKFLVDHRLSDNTVPLKAYTIAVEALGREASFDTETDSYPRVQISRLRRALDDFYLREGGDNRLSITDNHYEIAASPRPANETDSDALETGAMIGIAVVPSAKDHGDAGTLSPGQQINRRNRLSKTIVIAIVLFAILFASAMTYFLVLP